MLKPNVVGQRVSPRLVNVCRQLLQSICMAVYIMASTWQIHADDTEIFTGNVQGASGDSVANVMFIMDTSGSMTTLTDGSGSPQRIDVMKEGLKAVLDSLSNNINVGLMRFTKPGGPVLFPVENLNSRQPQTQSDVIVTQDGVETVVLGTDTGDFIGRIVLDGDIIAAPDGDGGGGGGADDISFRVRSTRDDAHQCTDGRDYRRSKYRVSWSAYPGGSCDRTVGIRFRELAIPQGTKIAHAYLHLTAYANLDEHPSVDIEIESRDSASSYSDSGGRRVVDRNTVDGLSVRWDFPNNINRYQEESSPDLVDLVQAVLDRPGWSSGNAINFIIRDLGNTGVVTNRAYYSRDGSSSRAPRLEIIFEDDPVQRLAGFRFNGVRVPQGATVTNARIDLTAFSDTSVSSNATLYIENALDSAEFTGADAEFTGRLSGATSIAVSLPAWNRDVGYELDVTSLIQSKVDQAGWCGGNALSFFLENGGGHEAYSLERDLEKAAVLHLDYDVADENDPGCNGGLIQSQIIDGNDDVLEDGGGRDFIDTLVEVDSSQDVGLRFQVVNLPPQPASGDLTIDAVLKLHTTSTSISETTLNVFAQLAGADSFVADSVLLTGRATTTPVSVTIPAADLSALAVDQRFVEVDISSVVSTILGQGSWQDGDGIVFVLDGQSGGFTFTAHEFSASLAPALVVRFQGDIGNSGPTVRERIKQLVDDLPADGGTPIASTLYEAARYFRGEAVEFGLTRYPFDNSDNKRKTRISSELSWDDSNGAFVSRDADCSDNNLGSSACESEHIETPNGPPNYISPIEAACQSNNIVLLTDGFPNDVFPSNLTGRFTDLTNNDIDFTSPDSCSAGDPFACSNNIASFLHNSDQSTTVDGINVVNTYTIGLDIDLGGLEVLAETHGGGEYFSVNNSAALVEAFQNIIGNILEADTTIAAPGVSVNQMNRFRHLNHLYYSIFRPSERVRWSGNLKRYRLDSGNPSLVESEQRDPAIVDRFGTAAVAATPVDPEDPDSTSNSQFVSTSVSFWNETADGGDARLGGAALHIPDPATRKVLTYTGEYPVPNTGGGATPENETALAALRFKVLADLDAQDELINANNLTTLLSEVSSDVDVLNGNISSTNINFDAFQDRESRIASLLAALQDVETEINDELVFVDGQIVSAIAAGDLAAALGLAGNSANLTASAAASQSQAIATADFNLRITEIASDHVKGLRVFSGIDDLLQAQSDLAQARLALDTAATEVGLRNFNDLFANARVADNAFASLDLSAFTGPDTLTLADLLGEPAFLDAFVLDIIGNLFAQASALEPDASLADAALTFPALNLADSALTDNTPSPSVDSLQNNFSLAADNAAGSTLAQGLAADTYLADSNNLSAENDALEVLENLEQAAVYSDLDSALSDLRDELFDQAQNLSVAGLAAFNQLQGLASTSQTEAGLAADTSITDLNDEQLGLTAAQVSNEVVASGNIATGSLAALDTLAAAQTEVANAPDDLAVNQLNADLANALIAAVDAALVTAATTSDDFRDNQVQIFDNANLANLAAAPSLNLFELYENFGNDFIAQEAAGDIGVRFIVEIIADLELNTANDYLNNFYNNQLSSSAEVGKADAEVDFSKIEVGQQIDSAQQVSSVVVDDYFTDQNTKVLGQTVTASNLDSLLEQALRSGDDASEDQLLDLVDGALSAVADLDPDDNTTFVSLTASAAENTRIVVQSLVDNLVIDPSDTLQNVADSQAAVDIQSVPFAFGGACINFPPPDDICYNQLLSYEQALVDASDARDAHIAKLEAQGFVEGFDQFISIANANAANEAYLLAAENSIDALNEKTPADIAEAGAQVYKDFQLAAISAQVNLASTIDANEVLAAVSAVDPSITTLNDFINAFDTSLTDPGNPSSLSLPALQTGLDAAIFAAANFDTNDNFTEASIFQAAATTVRDDINGAGGVIENIGFVENPTISALGDPLAEAGLDGDRAAIALAQQSVSQQVEDFINQGADYFVQQAQNDVALSTLAVAEADVANTNFNLQQEAFAAQLQALDDGDLAAFQAADNANAQAQSYAQFQQISAEALLTTAAASDAAALDVGILNQAASLGLLDVNATNLDSKLEQAFRDGDAVLVTQLQQVLQAGVDAVAAVDGAGGITSASLSSAADAVVLTTAIGNQTTAAANADLSLNFDVDSTIDTFNSAVTLLAATGPDFTDIQNSQAAVADAAAGIYSEQLLENRNLLAQATLNASNDIVDLASSDSANSAFLATAQSFSDLEQQAFTTTDDDLNTAEAATQRAELFSDFQQQAATEAVDVLVAVSSAAEVDAALVAQALNVQGSDIITTAQLTGALHDAIAQGNSADELSLRTALASLVSSVADIDGAGGNSVASLNNQIALVQSTFATGVLTGSQGNPALLEGSALELTTAQSNYASTLTDLQSSARDDVAANQVALLADAESLNSVRDQRRDNIAANAQLEIAGILNDQSLSDLANAQFAAQADNLVGVFTASDFTSLLDTAEDQAASALINSFEVASSQAIVDEAQLVDSVAFAASLAAQNLDLSGTIIDANNLASQLGLALAAGDAAAEAAIRAALSSAISVAAANASEAAAIVNRGLTKVQANFVSPVQTVTPGTDTALNNAKTVFDDGISDLTTAANRSDINSAQTAAVNLSQSLIDARSARFDAIAQGSVNTVYDQLIAQTQADSANAEFLAQASLLPEQIANIFDPIVASFQGLLSNPALPAPVVANPSDPLAALFNAQFANGMSLGQGAALVEGSPGENENASDTAGRRFDEVSGAQLSAEQDLTTAQQLVSTRQSELDAANVLLANAQGRNAIVIAQQAVNLAAQNLTEAYAAQAEPLGRVLALNAAVYDAAVAYAATTQGAINDALAAQATADDNFTDALLGEAQARKQQLFDTAKADALAAASGASPEQIAINGAADLLASLADFPGGELQDLTDSQLQSEAGLSAAVVTALSVLRDALFDDTPPTDLIAEFAAIDAAIQTDLVALTDDRSNAELVLAQALFDFGEGSTEAVAAQTALSLTVTAFDNAAALQTEVLATQLVTQAAVVVATGELNDVQQNYDSANIILDETIHAQIANRELDKSTAISTASGLAQTVLDSLQAEAGLYDQVRAAYGQLQVANDDIDDITQRFLGLPIEGSSVADRKLDFETFLADAVAESETTFQDALATATANTATLALAQTVLSTAQTAFDLYEPTGLSSDVAALGDITYVPGGQDNVLIAGLVSAFESAETGILAAQTAALSKTSLLTAVTNFNTAEQAFLTVETGILADPIYSSALALFTAAELALAAEQSSLRPDVEVLRLLDLDLIAKQNALATAFVTVSGEQQILDDFLATRSTLDNQIATDPDVLDAQLLLRNAEHDLIQGRVGFTNALAALLDAQAAVEQASSLNDQLELASIARETALGRQEFLLAEYARAEAVQQSVQQLLDAANQALGASINAAIAVETSSSDGAAILSAVQLSLAAALSSLGDAESPAVGSAREALLVLEGSAKEDALAALESAEVNKDFHETELNDALFGGELAELSAQLRVLQDSLVVATTPPLALQAEIDNIQLAIIAVRADIDAIYAEIDIAGLEANFNSAVEDFLAALQLVEDFDNNPSPEIAAARVAVAQAEYETFLLATVLAAAQSATVVAPLSFDDAAALANSAVNTELAQGRSIFASEPSGEALLAQDISGELLAAISVELAGISAAINGEDGLQARFDAAEAETELRVLNQTEANFALSLPQQSFNEIQADFDQGLSDFNALDLAIVEVIDAGGVDLDQSSNELRKSNSLAIGKAGLSNDFVGENIINWARGYDVPSTATNSNEENFAVRQDMGAPLHSTPLLINFGNDNNGAPIEVVFVSTNDGFLHAFDTNKDRNPRNPLFVSPTVDADRANGVDDDATELFAFMPQELLVNLSNLKSNPTGKLVYGLDSPWSFFRRDGNADFRITGEGQFDNPPTQTLIDAQAVPDAVYIYGGMRRGGNFYYAINVTDPEKPKLKFVVGRDAATGGRGAVSADDAAFDNMGQSWSQPVISRMSVPVEGELNADGDQLYESKIVMIFGGGYDDTHDLNTAAFAEAADDRGNSVYILDASTGEVIWRAGGTASGANKELADMKFGIPSQIRVVDIDGDNFLDFLYVVDLGGQVFRFGIQPDAADADGLFDAKVLAKLGRSVSGATLLDNRRFFETPAITIVNDPQRKALLEDIAQADENESALTAAQEAVIAAAAVEGSDEEGTEAFDALQEAQALLDAAEASIAEAGVVADDFTTTERNLDSRYVAITLGSGYRAHPLDGSTQEMFFMLEDDEVLDLKSSTNPSAEGVSDSSVLTLADLDNVTEKFDDFLLLKDGWFLELRNISATIESNAVTAVTSGSFIGEKILSKSIVVNDRVLFTSYVPSASASACTPVAGASRLYAVNIFNGAPLYNISEIDSEGDGIGRYVDNFAGGIVSNPQIVFGGEDIVLLAGLETDSATAGDLDLDLTVEVGAVRKTRWRARSYLETKADIEAFAPGSN